MALTETTPDASIPPRKAPIVSALPRVVRDPFRFLMDSTAESDGLIRIGAGPAGAYVVSHPDYVRQILVTNAGNYVKGDLMEPFRKALGNGLVTSEGAFWKRQRRLMQPAFHARQLASMADHIDTCIGKAIRRWEDAADSGRPVNFLDEFIELNIEIVLGALFSTSIDARRTERMRELTSEVFLGMASQVGTFFLPGWLPTPGSVRYRRAVVALDTEVYALIEERRAGAEQHDDLLGLLLAAEDVDTGERMSDRQLRDEIFTLFMAGYETTATSLTWMVYRLADRPEIVAAMIAELDRVTTGERPTFNDLPALGYGRRVIDEVFRLHPAFPIWFRMTVAPDQLGPYRLPAKAKIVLNPHITHRDPRFWDDPETFDPDRFLPDRFDARARHAYYPFGKGSRVCIGERLALGIAQLVSSAFIRKFEFSIQPGFQVIPRYVVTCQPKGGLPLILARR